MLKVLILGANGFIGRHLTPALAEKENIALTVFGRKNYFDGLENIRSVCGDFEDYNALKDALKDQHIVYHLISQTIPSSSWEEPLLEIEKNLKPTLQLLELAAESKIKKICFASSGGTVYGLQQDFLTEESPTEPFSPYGITKRTIESFLQYAKLKHYINYDIYRISNIFGEGQDIGRGLGFINTALENIVNNKPVVVYGDGENIRDYIYIKDVVSLLMSSVTEPLENSDVYNISSNHPISLNELIKLIRKIIGIDFEVQYVSGRPSDNRKVVLDNSKIMNCCKETLLTPLEDGIINTYSYLKKTKFYEKKGV